jgi:GTP-binding protein EngB required for normal cell division
VTALVEGARRLVGRGTSDVVPRLQGLEQATTSARGRLDDALIEEASGVVERASGRLRLSADHTVVALAGSTGSGKSSTFNALTGLDLAAVGLKRPTTSWTMACAWGPEGAGDLLDWLGVPRRHQVARNSMLDGPAREDRELQGLVLLDLPDHDSTEVSHHVEVDRLVRLTDVLVWVLDPQKYADAAVHDRYLRPLASHKDVMIIVLNHIDEVPEDRRASMVADLERILAGEGLAGVPVFPTSARHGDGITALKQELAARVAAKKSVRTRLVADVKDAAARLQEASGTAKPRDVARARREELVDTLADAAGVPTVVRAVDRATRVRARRATGWPLTKWVARFRPDPLRRLHLDLGPQGRELVRDARASVPEASQVQRARVDTVVRGVADDAAEGLTHPWTAAVRHASVARLDDLNDGLDRALSTTDLGLTRTPLWWRLVQVLQWVLFAAAVAGGAWLAGLAVMGYLQLPEPTTPDYRGVPIPTALLLGGVLAGVLLALVSRLLTTLAARRKARSAQRRLRASVAEVTDELVIAPIEAEIEAYRQTREGLAAALR